MGCAVLWSYAELFGGADGSLPFQKMVWVDQSPLQNQAPDWPAEYAHRGLTDTAALSAMQEQLASDPRAAYLDTVASCLAYRYDEKFGKLRFGHLSERELKQKISEDNYFFAYIAGLGDPTWYGKLMADHTAGDWRAAIANFWAKPAAPEVLVVASIRSGCFDPRGVLWPVMRLAGPDGKPGKVKGVTVDWGGHWCYWEEPERFDGMVLEFLQS
jgi:pimeloyl-ACP methyl ester carboxylesterase